jgi:transketolase
MKIDKSKTNSIRKAFGKTLAQIGELNKKIVVMDADLACSTQTKIFGDKFPERFFDCGIAEQDMIATAAGLASEGKIPFVASFAMFATGRTYDQIRNGVCYPDFNVKIIGTHGGVTVGEDGATHQALEDISLMRNVPHMTVIVPADCRECEEVIKYASLHDGPMYIRISRSNVPDIFDEHYHFNIHKAVVLEEGTDVSVFTNGETLAEVLLAAEELKEEGISVEVINVPVVKPLDFKTVIDSVKKTKFAVTVENHSVIGGLGSAICETLAGKYPSKVYRVGIHDEFGQSGKAEELVEYYGLDAKTLASRIRTMCKREKEQGNM